MNRDESMLKLTVDLQMPLESIASSGILSFALIRSRVVQLNVGNFKHCLGLPEPCFFGDVAIYLPPCDCWHWAAMTEVKQNKGVCTLCRVWTVIMQFKQFKHILFL